MTKAQIEGQYVGERLAQLGLVACHSSVYQAGSRYVRIALPASLGLRTKTATVYAMPVTDAVLPLGVEASP